MNIPWL